MTSSNMTIQGYLQSIREKLHVSPKESQKILREIQTHLMQEAKRLEKKGMSASDAEEQACSDFGDPAMIAKGFRKAYSWFFRTSLRVVALTLIVMVFVNRVPSWFFFVILHPEDNFIPFVWFDIVILASYTLFGAFVFWVVQKLTFSDKRLWQLLIVTIFSAYFGEILYVIGQIIFGMGPIFVDTNIVLSLFFRQFLKIIPMIVVYVFLYFVEFRKSTS